MNKIGSMPAKDLYHDHVRHALEKDGWTITHDPLSLEWRTGQKMFIDLGAEKLITAEKGTQKIAVEVKSFLGPSELEDLYEAIGQFILYRQALRRISAERELFLAIRSTIYKQLFADRAGEALRAAENIKLLVFNAKSQEITKWIL
jgi:hypothetical protein